MPDFGANDILDKAAAYVSSCEYELAETFTKKALELEPQNVDALELLGIIYTENGDIEKARQVLCTALSIKPRYETFFTLAQLLSGEEAIEMYKRGIAMIQQDVQEKETIRALSNAYCSIAEIFMTDCCDLPQAELECAQWLYLAINKDPCNPEAYAINASYKLIQRNYQEASALCYKSASLWISKDHANETGLAFPDYIELRLESQTEDMPNFECRRALCKILLELEHFDLCVFILRTLYEENDNDLEMLYLYAMCYWLQGVSAICSQKLKSEDKQQFIEEYISHSQSPGFSIDENASEHWLNSYELCEEARKVVQKSSAQLNEALVNDVRDLYETLHSLFGPFSQYVEHREVVANTINVKHLQQAQIEENRGVGPFDYKKWKSEQPAVCCVCLDDMETESMLVCSNEQCDVCVHYDCYAVPHNVKASTKAWSCDYCVAKTKGKAMEEACILCPAKGGALKRVGETTSWVHVACALWIPEVEYDPVTGHVSLLKVPAHRYNNFCCLCAEPEDAATGICISCKIEGIERHFHVTCAMKWGLLERAWKDLLTGGSTDIEELDYSDTSLSFNENPWIKWSSVREATNEIPKVIELTEHSLARLSQYDTFKSLIKPVPQHLLKTESALEMAVEAIVRKSECEDSKRKLSFPEKFSHHYAMYDDARERFITDSRKETTSLQNEKKELEGSVSGLATEIIALKESCQNQLDEFDQNVSELKKNHMALLAVFKHAFECGWDFSVLFDEEQDSEPFMQAVQNIRSKGSLDEKDFMVLIELLLHAQKPFFTSSFSQELIIEVLRNTLPDMKNVPDLPNLSKITTSLYSEFPSQKTNGLACDYCKSRVLPDSAPVQKEFRDYLLICCKCGSGFHLCCVQPEPLRQLPEEPDCWECFDCLHGCTIMKDECEDMLVDSEAYSVRKRARTASTTGPGRRVRKGSYAGPGRPPRMPVSASMSSLESKSWLSWEEARKSLLSLCAPCPPIPEKLQKKEGNELVLRLFVLKDPSEEEIQQLVDVALWRILTNIPPQADSRDILAMVAEGEAVGFGKFQRVMRSSNGSFESSQRSLSESALLSRSLSASHPTLLNSQQSISPTDLADVLNMGSDDRLSDPPDEEMEERRSVTSYITGSQDSLAEPKYSLCKIERQPSKWDGDLYKPFWTRGNGRSKEGWCGLCQPGHWLKTKTSVYWYHMHNYHGVSSVAGTFFQPPEELRDLEGVTEGRCHQCQKWIPIQGDKSLNVEEIYWYKHAQKCHKYSNEDAPFDNTSLQDEDEEYI